MDKQQLPKILTIYKKRGETPLEALTRLRGEHPEYKNEILSYAGRLDPMAEGILLVLVGKEANTKENREKYLGLDKTYEVEVLFGISTDTHDILGLIINNEQVKKILEKSELERIIQSFVGTYEQEYPVYSSKPVSGKPLFEWAREGRLAEIHIPKKEITIHEIKFTNDIQEISAKDLLENIEKDISKVQGDFRQEHILARWQSRLKNPDEFFQKVTILVQCSTGTYIRSLVAEIGKVSCNGALAMSIRRTKLGDFI